MKRQGLGADKDARRGGPVQQPREQEVEARVAAHYTDQVERHHDDLGGQADNDHAASAPTVGEDPNNRRTDDAACAIRGEDGADEPERQPDAHSQQRNDRKGNATRYTGQEHARRYRVCQSARSRPVRGVVRQGSSGRTSLCSWHTTGSRWYKSGGCRSSQVSATSPGLHQWAPGGPERRG